MREKDYNQSRNRDSSSPAYGNPLGLKGNLELLSFDEMKMLGVLVNDSQYGFSTDGVVKEGIELERELLEDRRHASSRRPYGSIRFRSVLLAFANLCLGGIGKSPEPSRQIEKINYCAPASLEKEEDPAMYRDVA